MRPLFRLPVLIFAGASVLWLPDFAPAVTQPVQSLWEAKMVARPANDFLPGLGHEFPVSLLLPKNCVVRPLHDTPARLNTGLLWGSPGVVEQFKRNHQADLLQLNGPLFTVGISGGVQQTGTNTFNLEGEKLEDQLKSGGVKDAMVSRVKWGAYPVQHYRGTRPNGKPVLGAWVGLNSPDGLTLYIDFKGRTVGASLSPDDEKVWQRFLTGTK